MKLFTQKDFNEYVEFDDQAKACADIANEKLANLVKAATTVYYGAMDKDGDMSCGFGIFPEETDTHKARLLFIEPILKAPCKHEPCNPFDGAYKCRHCGVAIIATWTSQSSYK